MKNLIILLLASTAFISCQKEEIQPNFLKSEKSSGKAKVECVYLFTENAEVSGHIELYSGQNLSYIHEFQASDIQDTLLNEEQPARFVKFTRYIDNSEIRQNEGWFYVNIYLEDSVDFVLNMNYINNRMALNGNELLPEPSHKVGQNTNVLFNFFKAEVKGNTIRAERITYDM